MSDDEGGNPYYKPRPLPLRGDRPLDPKIQRRLDRLLGPPTSFDGAIRERRPDGTYLPFDRVSQRTCPRCGRLYIPASIHHFYCNLKDCRTTFVVPEGQD